MRIALIGSVSSSWTVLKAFIDHHVDVACVCGVDESRADMISDYRSLAELAEPAGIPYISFIKASEPEVAYFIRKYQPDQLWVIGLSQLVNDDLIDIAPHGGIGFHPTMLPEGRGRAPVAWTILRGARAAVSLFTLTAEADAGDLIYQCEVPVLPDDYSHQLIDRTNEYLYKAVGELAPQLRWGPLTYTPQDHSRATFYEKRTPADGLIDWSQSSEQIYRLIRAAGRPYLGAFTYLPTGEKLIIWRARPAEHSDTALQAAAISGPGGVESGRVLTKNEYDGPLIKTHDGGLWLTETEMIVPPGQRFAGPRVPSDGTAAPHDAFHRIRIGDRLGQPNQTETA